MDVWLLSVDVLSDIRMNILKYEWSTLNPYNSHNSIPVYRVPMQWYIWMVMVHTILNQQILEWNAYKVTCMQNNITLMLLTDAIVITCTYRRQNWEHSENLFLNAYSIRFSHLSVEPSPSQCCPLISDLK